MLRAIADTHALLWYLYGDARLSPRGRDLIDNAAASGDTIGIATISFVEIVYLMERGRIASDALMHR